MRPNFIGLGAQKCASTWLRRVLQDHPDTYVGAPREIDFFSSYYDRGFQWYEANFAAAARKSAVGEISPSYFPDSDAPARAHAYNPGFRIIVALRDPIERAYSNHLHEIRLAQYSGSDLSFEAGLANNPMYVEQSRYATHLSRWLDYFPPGQILVVLQEEIQADPQREARRVYEFLGISTDHVSGFVEDRANQSYLPKSRSREEFLKRSGSLIRKLGMSWLVNALRRTGVVAAIHRGNRLNIREIVPPMREETREKLYQVLGLEALELASVLGRQSLPWKTWARAAGVGLETVEAKRKL